MSDDEDLGSCVARLRKRVEVRRRAARAPVHSTTMRLGVGADRKASIAEATPPCSPSLALSPCGDRRRPARRFGRWRDVRRRLESRSWEFAQSERRRPQLRLYLFDESFDHASPSNTTGGPRLRRPSRACGRRPARTLLSPACASLCLAASLRAAPADRVDRRAEDREGRLIGAAEIPKGAVLPAVERGAGSENRPARSPQGPATSALTPVKESRMGAASARSRTG